ncbi:hypothetical protein [Cohnella silvisoli]|uniref:t-SNARE coiled-coil homology domain-containing protein n=1 Tax=Cohnella silvisoli TaxID=2873699 RepID=A0ABV1KT79_9BACL|nr:hypothetical protein [Cohnella silvisoli]MCD9022970.1 hypothetical protein [Cohnella silvisoli]
MDLENMNALRQIIQEQFQPINKRLDAIDLRLNTIDLRLDAIENRFDTVQSSLDRIEAAQNDDVISSIKLTNNKLDDLRQDVEYTLKEQATIKLQIDRSKRTNYKNILDQTSPL